MFNPPYTYVFHFISSTQDLHGNSTGSVTQGVSTYCWAKKCTPGLKASQPPQWSTSDCWIPTRWERCQPLARKEFSHWKNPSTINSITALPESSQKPSRNWKWIPRTVNVVFLAHGFGKGSWMTTSHGAHVGWGECSDPICCSPIVLHQQGGLLTGNWTLPEEFGW